MISFFVLLAVYVAYSIAYVMLKKSIIKAFPKLRKEIALGESKDYDRLFEEVAKRYSKVNAYAYAKGKNGWVKYGYKNNTWASLAVSVILIIAGLAYSFIISTTHNSNALASGDRLFEFYALHGMFQPGLGGLPGIEFPIISYRDDYNGEKKFYRWEYQ